MKIKNYHYIIDTTFYFLLCAMPFLIGIAVAVFGGLDEVGSLVNSLRGVFEGTSMYSAVSSVIGVDGTSPLLNANLSIFIDFICYVVYITILHLIIDCIQFIPQLCHKFMSHVGGKDFE